MASVVPDKQISSPHFIRITSQGKLRNWISFSLEFLETESDAERVLVLHTLPPQFEKHLRSSSIDDERQLPEKKATCKPDRAADLVPRLISVVELIKREYVKKLENNKSSRLIGLHQYNDIGYIEDLEPATEPSSLSDEQRTAEILQALEGKNYLKQKQTPYMAVTLSTEPLFHLIEKGSTYQAPLRRKLSKSAKTRAKKREKKAVQPVEGEEMAVD